MFTQAFAYKVTKRRIVIIPIYISVIISLFHLFYILRRPMHNIPRYIHNQDILLSHIIFSHCQMYKLPHLFTYIILKLLISDITPASFPNYKRISIGVYTTDCPLSDAGFFIVSAVSVLTSAFSDASVAVSAFSCVFSAFCV